MNVYEAISAVQSELAATGIAKDRTNKQQGYQFRGIDDMYNVIAPLLAKHKLCVLPSYADRAVVEREAKSGGALFYVNVSGSFTFVSAEDGTKHTAGPFYGEAMDSGDKATNKAQSASFKYMCMQVFCIPTDGDNDADSTTHEVKTRPNTATQVAKDTLAAMPPEEQDFLRTHASEIKRLHANGQEVRSYYETQRFDAEEKLALWAMLPSDIRAAIKRQPERHLAEQG